MKQDLWQRAEAVFHAALERAPDVRARFLDEACGTDGELRTFVEELLSEDARADSFLEKPALPDRPGVGDVAGSPVGRQYGPYRIVALLGAGGMGEVYRARDGKLGRAVAIKTLPREFARDPRRLARFRREARMLASLNHPNIAAIYGLEESPDGDFLVLELVEGECLRGPQPLATALDLAAQVADALHAAHAHGIVHRDLKPANVKVTPQGQVKVLDFGLAKAVWGSETNADLPGPSRGATGQTTATGHILGTPGYMSPEQARGEAVDQRTDVWAFGCLLYEVLTGGRAFACVTAADPFSAVLEREPDWLALSADVPAEVRYLLRRCLHKEADSRPSSLADIRAALRRAGEASRAGRVAPPAMPQAISSLAVLPFTNAGTEPEDQFLGDGIAEDLLTVLSSVPGLRVPGRMSCFAFKGRPHDLAAIGQALGVETVLDGSVRRSGSRLRITAELIKVADGFHVWSERYDREMADVLAIQDEIARAIAAALVPALSGPAVTLNRPSTGSIDAYELCLRARYHHLQRTPEGLATALRLFEEAVTRDPNCALAHAGISHVLLLMCYFGGLPTSVGMPRMKAAALRALELDATLAVAHVRLADALCFKDWDWAGAEREFLRALDLDPDSTEARWRYALFLWSRRRYPEALVQVRKGLALDPISLDANWILGWVLNSLRRFDEAADVAGRMLAMDPNVWLGYHVRAIASAGKGEQAAAVRDFETMTRIEGGPSLHSLLCWCYAQVGRMADARRTLEQVEQMMAHRIAPSGWLVWAYHAVGDTARARAAFDQAIAERHMMMVHIRGHMAMARGAGFGEGFPEEFRSRLDELGL